mmetsp:Transcript_109286/g.352794  ORF Transcript_109286/g.352794 Transcript_109286/m.352794 type:complete len:234 (-) Transcript_109286:1001-1702(-)
MDRRLGLRLVRRQPRLDQRLCRRLGGRDDELRVEGGGRPRAHDVHGPRAVVLECHLRIGSDAPGSSVSHGEAFMLDPCYRGDWLLQWLGLGDRACPAGVVPGRSGQVSGGRRALPQLGVVRGHLRCHADMRLFASPWSPRRFVGYPRILCLGVRYLPTRPWQVHAHDPRQKCVRHPPGGAEALLLEQRLRFKRVGLVEQHSLSGCYARLGGDVGVAVVHGGYERPHELVGRSE